ncbi:FAD-dependent monooxygenase [Sphingobacterium rhinopitheci]|uniref:FAD-dependent monooxygenase n=1 Tax=Sphingobacterium rhinopitheci TaxID=2781960 RepID=UPI001F520780|nr:FAD-dependent monooxygenase [Sphingobacterium rhinopitheci]MCI0921611.1 FAD-dependent monooxygenase [Sphingobacterium rhinopitheci]
MNSEFAIIGGGVAGLSAAIGLQSINSDFMLFEQSALVKGIGAGFGLAANAMQALDFLGLKEDIEKIGHHVSTYNILDQQGNILLAPDTNALSDQYKQDNFTIHRADLHHYLHSKIPVEKIVLNKRAIKFTQQKDLITLYFEDGTQHECRYLIIADGVKSPLRQQLIPSSAPRYAGYTCWRATIDNSDIKLNKGSETWGKAGRFGMTPLVGNRVYWYACINAPAQSSKFKNYTISNLIEDFKDYHTPIPQILAQTKDKDLIWNDIIDIKPLQNLAYANILLIGDAGHATTPNMGQGACQALEDVAVLIDELGHKEDVIAAFQSFEKRRLARTKYITETSKFIGEVAQWENKPLVFLRNTILKKLPSKFTQRDLQKLLSVDFMKINT